MKNKKTILNFRNNFFKNKIKKTAYLEKIYENWHAILFQYNDLISKSNIKEIRITAEQVIIETNNQIKLCWIPGDRRIAPAGILNFKDYEVDETKIVSRLMKNRKCFYDVGANIGWYSLNIAKKYKYSQIYSFEPVSKTFGYLIKNIMHNKLSNIKAFNLGFSDTAGKQSFYVYPEGSGNASMRNLSKKNSVYEVKCKLETMDNFRKKNNHIVDFIKIDTEGSELLVLKGAQAILSEDQPIIFSEILRKWSKQFGYKANDILIFLRTFGYDCFEINKDKLLVVDEINRETIKTNFIFLNKKKHRKEIRYFSKKK